MLLAGAAIGVYYSVVPSGLWAALESPAPYAAVAIQHPFAGAVMPANMPAPVVFWQTNAPDVGRWVAGFKAGGQRWMFDGIQPMWRPPEADWLGMKKAANGGPIELILAGYGGDSRGQLKARSSLRFAVGREAVEHALFYREVNLPFKEAVKDPSHIRWRFGGLGKGTLPPVVLEHLPVCGNCHSFSRNGEYLAMDVDYANNKASYVITRTGREMRLATSDIITWDDFRREDGQLTFGLLSQISPDGRYVLSTVKDKSVFAARPGLAFSQLFFPFRGIIAVYDREAKRFFSLPGADDPALVQSNPTWSPDGQWVVFARTRASELPATSDPARILFTPEELKDFLSWGKEFRYDLYRMPFNGGKGGAAEPLRGASANGRSNYFPKFSPDGRWLVFCQAANYMLLQPDSELFIIPAAGGEARRLGCNLSRMNSWHSWSPDGRWLVFSSKAHSDYTQLYLSRVNEQGEASPAVWLAHMVAPGWAANIPEFVALAPEAIVKVREQFLDDYSYTRAGDEFYREGDADGAIERYKTALSLNPNNALAHRNLAFLLYNAKKQVKEAIAHMEAAVKLEPRNAFAQSDLGTALLRNQGDLSNAVLHLREAVRLLPDGTNGQYNPTDMNLTLAEACYRLSRYPESILALEEVLRRNANHAGANYTMAMAKAWLGETDAASPYYERAIRSEPQLSRVPDYYDALSRIYVNKGLYADGLKAAEQACRLAVEAGQPEQAAVLRERVEQCRRLSAAKAP